MTKSFLFWFAASLGVSVAAYVLEPLVLNPYLTLALPLAYLAAYSIEHDALHAVWCGALAGVTLDLLHGMPLGVHAGAFLFAGWSFARIARFLALRHIALRVIALAVSAFIFFPTHMLLGALAGVEFQWNFPAALFLITTNVLCLIFFRLVRAATTLRPAAS